MYMKTQAICIYIYIYISCASTIPYNHMTYSPEYTSLVKVIGCHSNGSFYFDFSFKSVVGK